MFSQSHGTTLFFSTWSRLWLMLYPKIIIRNYIYIITVKYLNEIYKIIYKYILSFKILDIIGGKPSQSFKTMH